MKSKLIENLICAFLAFALVMALAVIVGYSIADIAIILASGVVSVWLIQSLANRMIHMTAKFTIEYFVILGCSLGAILFGLLASKNKSVFCTWVTIVLIAVSLVFYVIDIKRHNKEVK